VFQLLGDFVPRPHTAAPPLDPAGGLPSPRPPRLCSSKISLKNPLFYMSPQCRQNVLHVACIQKLNMYRRHHGMYPVSATCPLYPESKIDQFLHVSRSGTCSTAGHMYPVDQRMPVVPSTCRRSVDRNVLHVDTL